MSDERKPVMCPRGHEMELISGKASHPLAGYTAYYHCKLCWDSPGCGGLTQKEAENAAYAAATAAPPNPPLTREQVEKLDDLDAVWVVRGRGDAYTVMVVEAMRLEHVYTNGEVMFGHRPTPADIEAARKERAGF